VVLKIVLGGLAVLALGVVAAALVGSAVWRRGTDRLRSRRGGYQERDGTGIPTEGEVGWELPSGYHPYWRGTISEVSFEFVGAESP
jgi:hypothetical protein